MILLNQGATGLMRSEAPREALREAITAVAREIGDRYSLFYRVDEEEPGHLVLDAAGGLDGGATHPASAITQVTSPTRKGFGHVMIESMVAQMVNGEVSTDFGADGLNWTLNIPMSHLVNAEPA